jgi:hypothetical protein
MIAARKVALRVNGMQVTKATLRRGETVMQLVIADPIVGDSELGSCEDLNNLAGEEREFSGPPGYTKWSGVRQIARWRSEEAS